jgi:hypothetical protein
MSEKHAYRRIFNKHDPYNQFKWADESKRVFDLKVLGLLAGLTLIIFLLGG